MRFISIVVFASLLAQADEMRGKIDMHGGKEQPMYEKKDNYKSDFSVKSFRAAAFGDKNATKERKKPTKK